MLSDVLRHHMDLVLLWMLFGPLVGLAVGVTLASPAARWRQP
jgi:hypothetical protein